MWSHSPRSRAREVSEHRREVVGDHDAVELRQRDRRAPLVGRAERLEHRHGVVAVEALQQRELHVGEHERAVTLRDKHRTGEVGVGDRPGVDEPRVRRHRVDAESGPGEIGERQARHDLDRDVRGVRRVLEQLHGALGDDGASRHRVHDVAVVERSQQRVDHSAVRGLEVGRRVVHVVERLELHPFGFELDDGEMAAGARDVPAVPLERPAGAREEEVGSRRPEPHDDQAAIHAGQPVQPRAGTRAVAVCPTSRTAGRPPPAFG